MGALNFKNAKNETEIKGIARNEATAIIQQAMVEK